MPQQRTDHDGYSYQYPSEYRTWAAMKRRCYNENDVGYVHYGGRGITVCKRWRESFRAFVDDMGSRPTGKSIDRIDNNKGYSPSNCRWATRKQQRDNQRKRASIPQQPLNLIQPKDWKQAFQAEAEQRGVSLSEWMGECCKAFLPDAIANSLSERPRQKTPTLPAGDSTKPIQTSRKNMIQPTVWWDAIEQQCKRNNQNFSEYAGECMIANLDQDLSEGLPRRIERGRPRKKP